MPFALIGFFIGVKTEGYYHKINKVGNLVHNILPHNTPSSFKDYALLFIFVILCMVFARSAAMAFNRYLDRKYDAKNPRTAVREIPAGIISPQNALIFTIISCALFVLSCAFINRICFYLSPVALAVILGYSYTKRFTPLCHLVLGLGLSLAPIGAYLAVTGHFSLLPVLFSICVFFWVSGFDIIYALQDVEFDRSQNLYSIPAWLGRSRALHISEFLHLFSAAAVIYAGAFGYFSYLYWIGAGLFIGMLIYQHLIVKPGDLRRVNLAFMTTNGIASVVFAAFVIADLFIN